MKKGILTGLVVFYSLLGQSQSGEVTNAILALKDGAIADAKQSIDKASVHEKTSKEPKTWLYVGKVYEAVALEPSLSKQNPEAAKTAFNAYQKAAQLDATSEKPGKFKKDIDEALSSQNLAIAIQNSGIMAYQDKKIDLSYDYFFMFQQIKPKDTLGYIYAAQMALAQDKYTNAKTSYINCIEKTGYVSQEIITNLLYIYKTSEADKDYNKALEYVKLGRAKFPSNQNFVSQEADLLQKTGKLPEAITSFEALVKSNPSSENYLVLGSLYEKNNQLDKAKETYANALSTNPNSFEANFNMGAMLFNPAVEILKEVRNMGVADYNKKGKQMETQAKDILKQSLSYFEKANQIKPDDVGTKKTLKELYINLGMKDKADSIK